MAFRIFFISGLLFILFQGCAKMGTPTGGPKDVYPPEYISGAPSNKSVNFSGDQVDIYFNEYIQLKDQNKEILISPPMNEKPLVRIRDKSIRVTFNEDLLPQTTYTINFGKSLADLNEGNILPDFDFVFSTGNVIDSLSVTGTVADAYTLVPEKETPLLVMLYENLADSAPLQEIPRYYGRSNANGLFAINNIHPDTFRIIALKDANNNLKYDAGLENIAFMDSLLIINAGNVHLQSFIKDTLKIITPVNESVRKNKKDTTAVDTIIAPGKQLHAISVSMFSFMEENNKVFVTSREREAPNYFRLTFNRKLFDPLKITPLNFVADSNWIIPEANANNDTITFWVRDTLTAAMDTFKLKLTYTTTDSLNNFISKTDTIRLRKPAAAKGRESRRKSRESAGPDNAKVMTISSNVSGRGNLNLNASLKLTCSHPILKINPDSIEFRRQVDTVFIPDKFRIAGDTTSVRKFSLASEWVESTRYKLLFKPGSVTDIYGFTNDSTQIDFNTQAADFYGRILLNFSSYIYPMIVQVLNEKGNVVQSAVAKGPGIITYQFVTPGKYSFKAIIDENGNGKWDSGSYLKHRQPEKVFISGKPEQLRSNWDMEPSWSVSGVRSAL
jgi:hypothetical protein